MKARSKVSFCLALAMILTFLLAACTGSSNPAETSNVSSTDSAENKISSSPNSEVLPPKVDLGGVTLAIGMPWGEETFDLRFGYLKKKLNVNLEYVQIETSAEAYQNAFANGTKLDILVPDPTQGAPMTAFQELDLIYPLDDLIKKYKFDLSKLNPSLVSYVRSQDPEGRFVGMPDGANYMGMYYNKKVFDILGVPYPDPEKPMTWDELLTLAEKMNVEVDGNKYTGFQFGYNNIDDRWMLVPLLEFAVNATDPKTGEVLLTKKPEFTRYLELMKRFFDTPGNYVKETTDINLLAIRRGAMGLHFPQLFKESDYWGDLQSEAQELDLIPMPVWPDRPGIGHHLWTSPLTISKHSEHKEEAFQVLMEYASPENQLNYVKAGDGGTILADKNIQVQYGADHEAYKGKNIKALYALTPATFDGEMSKWDAYVDWHSALRELAKGKKDVQTILRELQERSAARIATVKAMK